MAGHVGSTIVCTTGMMVVLRLLLCALIALAIPRAVAAAPDATLVRIYLTDGTSLVSYGEYARVNDRVMFSMPVGGSAEDPRLHVVTLAVDAIDWTRTERAAASARHQRYAATRGDEDYLVLTSEVARVLNEIALTTDARRALAIALQARRTLAEWPNAHFGYRQDEVRDLVAFLDEAIDGLRVSAGASPFALSIAAVTPPVELEPVVDMPDARAQLDQVLRVLPRAERAAERIALLQTALTLLSARGSGIDAREAEVFRKSVGAQLRTEIATDRRYARISERLLNAASRAAAEARVDAVERVLERIPDVDARLGGRRPETVQALRASVEAHLEAARVLRLARDRWSLRQGQYREYQRSVGRQFRDLVRAQPLLEAIRRLDGPSPERLGSLRARLEGGAEQLHRLQVSGDLLPAHQLLVSAWRFAETAVAGRVRAIATGDMGTAWQASSAAAAAVMLLSRTQQEIRALLEPPRLP